MTYRAPFTLAFAGLLAACGGGSGPSTTLPPDTAARGPAPDPCAAELPARLMGDYAGTLTLDATTESGLYCTWATTVTISGRESGGECALSASVAADVEQSVFPESGTAGAAECPPIRSAPAALHHLMCWRWWWRHRGAARVRRGVADRHGSPPAAAACTHRPLSAGPAASAAAGGRRRRGGTVVVALVPDAGSIQPAQCRRGTRHECGAVAHIPDGAAVLLLRC